MPLSPILLEAQSGHVPDEVVNDPTTVAVLVDPSTLLARGEGRAVGPPGGVPPYRQTWPGKRRSA